MMVQFPIGFCPGSKEGIKLNCTGNFGIVLKEWETITRVSIICTTWKITSYFANWPILYNSRRATARIFQLNSNKSETAQDIDLKFSAFVHHMFGLNRQENFCHCSINESAPPSHPSFFISKTVQVE